MLKRTNDRDPDRVAEAILSGLPAHGDLAPDWVKADRGQPDDDWQPPDEIPEAADVADVPRPPRASVLNLTFFDDCGAFIQKRSILKGVIARGETSAWIAPPGAGKSALLTEISVHCAGKIDWRGHKAMILALERGDLFKRRLQVYSKRDGLHGLPIAVADAVIDLLNPNCVDIIVSTVALPSCNSVMTLD
jgi:hypothetical protein